MPVKVSVIIPVYNPGIYIEDCITSLQRQSLPPDEYEVIFVDDGSTDGTPARLDALASEDPRVTVVHQENSGWSGKPRNVGIAAAKGEYVMFVDNDDYLGDEALERMYDYGVAHSADVVVGKMAGKGRGVPVELFRRNHPRASVENAPLIDSLTPHKMFRREFLDEIGLRFPEGRRRLEDHVFVTEAYLRAGNVSVLSDYVCYYHVKRDDASNAGFQRFDPVGYFKNLREALDVVDRYTEPGPVRDRLHRRWLRIEMVERMRGKRLLTAPEEYRRELFREIHGVVVERFAPGVAAGLPLTQRIIAALIAADRLDDLVAFAEWEASVGVRAEPGAIRWEDGALKVDLTAEYRAADAVMTFPSSPAGAATDGAPKDVTEAIALVGADTVTAFGKATADLLLRERSSSAQYFQSVEVTREMVPVGDGERVRLVLRATATIDPATAADGVPPGGGLWDALVRVRLGGWTKECRLGPSPRKGDAAAPAGVPADRVVLPYWTAKGQLALDVDRATKRLGLSDLTRATVTGDRLSVPVPVYIPGETTVVLRLTAASGSVDVPGTLTPDGDGSVLEAAVPVAELEGTPRRLALCLVPGADEPRFLPLPFGLRAGSGTVQVVRPPVPGAVRKLARRARRLLGRVRRAAVNRLKARRA
ncbi:cell wall biosynthesis glycosyltransferase [Streptomyces lincolnensis]|uniref:Cell wall biosynthesis glycosyltransferase n=1 Tax=Streptomyces lincolnensis TaxID=1915 RepID=A0A1B1MMZ3_STRLN|nr:glycosyltransferase family A protein [Streptomyces lincolnensis]ANS69975.1 cell wall biosynthesis glycosyltransferase [Streptomyces lincolnensis]AXG58872.1 cell wall biosynthesis glycosyltransferase [Streptomyces lincolnensis]QMV11490.1 glycosyltransferase [Streptomyces lincolnensis]